MRILLAEDDELLGDGIRSGLTQYQYNVDWVKNGMAAWSSLQTEHFDMVILDLGLPKLSGEDLLKNIRLKNIDTPVIILTARDNITDLIKGLDTGADDYVIKPFDLEELCARIRAIQRRTTSRSGPIIAAGDVTLDPATRLVFKSGLAVDLSRREFVLMQMLMENAGHVLAREQITQSLYGWGDDIDSNALEVHIHNLRKKFGNNTIITVRGVGYMLEKNKKA
ncbi:MAG: QseB [uncultured bacterium]|nr:MAG: QseB [uncultured bacterium]HBS51875.1 DNA-binding response regulator [Coxiellaceae bacterium]